MGSIYSPPNFTINIIGAGIAGLAAGLALAKKGHKVTIFESNSQLSELGAGIQIQPNATRVLYHWGLQDEFRQVANEPSVMKLMRYANGATVGEIAHNPQCLYEYGYPHWQVYRPDLQRLLFDAAKQAGVEVMFGCKVADIDCEKGKITLADGSERSADLVVAADGILSKNRERLPANAGIKAVSCHEYCFRTIIPKEKMNSDPETAELMKGEDSNIWLGPGTCVLGYTVSGGDKYNALISIPGPSDAPISRWNEPGDVNEAQNLVKDYCSAVRKLWSHVDSCAKWTLGEVPRINKWVSDSGNFVMIGDAAHAIVPHAGQGGGMALEDCAALAEFVSAAHKPEDLAALMKAYQSFREERLDTIRSLAKGNQKFLSMEDGPGQEQRDKLFGVMTAKWKAELEELGEEGYRKKPRPEAIPGSDIRSPESRQYMLGYDVFAESRKALRKHGFA